MNKRTGLSVIKDEYQGSLALARQEREEASRHRDLAERAETLATDYERVAEELAAFLPEGVEA